MHTTLKHIITADGSSTLAMPELNEQYHSVNGAVNESKLVYIQNGLNAITSNEITILEIGFGTGLNCLLTGLEISATSKIIHYTALEPYPLSTDIIGQLNYPSLFEDAQRKKLFADMHSTNEGTIKLLPNFTLQKINTKLETAALSDKHFDLVYFDAFAPAIQPELWTLGIFTKLHKAMKKGAILVTYCAKGEVKRNLKQAGFSIENPAGPIGKREMTRATA